ncbi:MAG: hypothetical protein A4E52_00989 [Pelotomaculum sp. PtaB.Bin013]|uniref:DUF3794 domain-containing protein n=1 Tax=Pelotomaculum isophthalicicum JI TaxID=947010 RepID=A0A9X4H4V5_9FIRM|nr:SPOCS domain-containing protein [Pelotomaculum isophthalicicum]MDF9407079.1 DUF3794 domain-containing protein [Pelotomaculum isophthalicicum JI]OPX89543.1 MAG: hypothetical protein A4E52_00989 [Pelotomaculum sp. PtaB.Bin013]
MPEQFYYTEVQPVKCIEIRVPLVIASVDVEVVVDNIATLPELVHNCDRIKAHVRDLTGTPVFVEEAHHHHDDHFHHDEEFVMVHHDSMHPFRDLFLKKIVVNGTLHKKIFYVNKNNEVKFVTEDLPFSKLVELAEPVKVHHKHDVTITFRHVDVDVNFEIHRGCRVHQTSVIQATARVTEDRKIYVQTCPSPEEAPVGNLLRDGGLEAWASPYSPVFWGASNVSQTTTAHSGSFAAEIGLLNTALPGALFQMISKKIVGERQYRLTFWVREDVLGATSAFSLTAEVVFYDQFGTQIGIGTQTLPSTGIPDNAYTQVQFTTPAVDSSVDSIMVRFTFTPSTGNTNTVKIDDVMLECMRKHY